VVNGYIALLQIYSGQYVPMFFPNRPGFVEDITKHLGVFSWFTVPVAVHLQNTNAKIHKVV